MAREIERKFLVDVALLGPLFGGDEMRQGYISIGDRAVVRVRLAAGQAWLTLKGSSCGSVRSEFEYEIPAEDGRQMIDEFCGGRVICKTRYQREYANYLWEIDVFAGENAGLIVAEVELSAPNEQPPLPAWVGLEVTKDSRYFNNSLYTHPFSEWGKWQSPSAGPD
jgi:adenylate cyclase